MNHDSSRRAFMKGIGGTIAGTAALGASGTAAAADDATAGETYTGTPLKFTGVSYDSYDRKGAIVEDIVYESASACEISDLHMIVDDGTDTYNVRDDAASSDIGRTVAQLDEIYLSSTVPTTYGDVEVYQQPFVNETDNTPSILVRNDVTLPAGGDYTITTLANPDIGDESDNEAYLVEDGYYDVFVATDGNYYTAFAQRDDWRKAFDDEQVGIEGTVGSAWRDAYLDGDNDLTGNEQASGDVDLAFNIEAEAGTEFRFITALGFGTTEAAAVDNAVASLESGYEDERQASYW